VYKSFNQEEIKSLEQILSVIRLTTIEMISCYVLIDAQNDYHNNTKDLQKKQIYNIRQLLISCLDKKKRDFFDQAIDDIITDTNGRIKITTKKTSLGKKNSKKFYSDILIVEEILNKQNEIFHNNVDAALKRGNLIREKLEKRKKALNAIFNMKKLNKKQ
jgi:hypothetical protein